MAQIFVGVYENHVDWTKLIYNDDNYKNKLQVIIQKEFKITPDYVEIKNDILNNHVNDSINNIIDEDINEKIYIMGLYISFGQNIHNANIDDAISYSKCGSFKNIHALVEKNPKLLVFICKAEHKIKKKAEQLACENAIKLLESNFESN